MRAFEPPFWRHSTAPPYAEIDEHDLDDWDSPHLIIETADGLVEFAVGTTDGEGYAYGLDLDFDLIVFSLSTVFV